MQYANISFGCKVLVSPRLARTHTHIHVPPTFTPLTKGKAKVAMGLAPPIGTFVDVSKATAPSVCVCCVNVGGICLCVCASLGLPIALYSKRLFVYRIDIHKN